MIFKTKSTLSCTRCGIVKTFNAEADVYAQNARDGLEIKAWDSVEVPKVELEGLCPDCKYNNAA